MITGIFPPDIGGPATYVSRMAQALTQNGHQVHVITQGDDDAGENPYPVHRISRRYPLPLRLLLLFVTFLREGWRSDVWYINGLELPAVLAGKVLGKRLVMKVVGDYPWERAVNKGLTTDSIDTFQHRRQTWQVELHKILRAWYTRQADTVITPSRYLQDIVRGWGISPDRINVIYNAVEALPEIPPTRLAARQQLGLQNAERLIVTVGRLVPWKGIDQIIEAVAGMEIEVTVLIIGDGPERPHLLELSERLSLAQRIKFIGKVDRQRVLSYIKAADIFVLNSTYEGLPHVVLEAMSVGTPVVASAAGGTPEVVKDGETGRLLPLSDVQALQQALSELLASQEEQTCLVQGSQTMLQKFCFSRMLQDTEHALSRLQPRQEQT